MLGALTTSIRNGQPADMSVTTKNTDRAPAASPLHEFLESIGRAWVDAHIVCEAIEGQSIHSVTGISNGACAGRSRESLVKPPPTIYPVTLPL